MAVAVLDSEIKLSPWIHSRIDSIIEWLRQTGAGASSGGSSRAKNIAGDIIMNNIGLVVIKGNDVYIFDGELFVRCVFEDPTDYDNVYALCAKLELENGTDRLLYSSIKKASFRYGDGKRPFDELDVERRIQSEYLIYDTSCVQFYVKITPQGATFFASDSVSSSDPIKFDSIHPCVFDEYPPDKIKERTGLVIGQVHDILAKGDGKECLHERFLIVNCSEYRVQVPPSVSILGNFSSSANFMLDEGKPRSEDISMSESEPCKTVRDADYDRNCEGIEKKAIDETITVIRNADNVAASNILDIKSSSRAVNESSNQSDIIRILDQKIDASNKAKKKEFEQLTDRVCRLEHFYSEGHRNVERKDPNDCGLVSREELMNICTGLKEENELLNRELTNIKTTLKKLMDQFIDEKKEFSRRTKMQASKMTTLEDIVGTLSSRLSSGTTREEWYSQTRKNKGELKTMKDSKRKENAIEQPTAVGLEKSDNNFVKRHKASSNAFGTRTRSPTIDSDRGVEALDSESHLHAFNTLFNKKNRTEKDSNNKLSKNDDTSLEEYWSNQLH